MSGDADAARAFDPKQAYQALKSHEGMLAFTGFKIGAGGNGPQEGVLKIARQTRPYKGDELILTFIIDARPEGLLKPVFDGCFKHLAETHCPASAGARIERLHQVGLEFIGELPNWYVREVHFFLKDREVPLKTLLEKDLLPWLAQALEARFEALEWWPQESVAAGQPARPGWRDSAALKPLQRLWERWRPPR